MSQLTVGANSSVDNSRDFIGGPINLSNRLDRFSVTMIVCAVLGISGCATGYKPEGFFSGGYDVTKLQDDLYQISFRGNGRTSPERADHFALLRAAELAAESGNQFIEIIQDKSYIKSESFTTAGVAHTQGQIYGGQYQGQTTYSGGETYTSSKPRASKLIKLHKTKPDYPGMIFDAQQIISNLRAKYRLPPRSF